MVLSALLTLQFFASNPSSTSGRGEVHPEQDVHDSWDTLNNARESPRTVPTSPSLPSALLVPLPGPRASKEQSESLQTGAGVRLGHRKSPSVPARLCPALTCRLSQRKKGCTGR